MTEENNTSPLLNEFNARISEQIKDKFEIEIENAIEKKMTRDGFT